MTPLSKQQRWDSTAYAMADLFASQHSQQDKQVGACLVSPDRRQYSFGYNGPPKSCRDWDEDVDAHIHAELNAVLNAKVDITGWTMFTTFHPCLACAANIIQKDLARVICPPIDEESEWAPSQLEAQKILLRNHGRLDSSYLLRDPLSSVEARLYRVLRVYMYKDIA